MNKSMCNYLKNKKGITLIALVITIIVLLILAGVTISTLTGQNGLLNRAKTASEKTNYESAKEIVLLKLMEVQTDCSKKREVYSLLEIAKEFNMAEETTLLKYYNKSIGVVQTENDSLTTDLDGIVVTVDQYNKYSFLIGESLEIEGITTGIVTDTTPKSEFTDVDLFEKMSGIDLSQKVIATTSQIDSSYYGKYVEYTPINGCDVKWRIFYKDESNVYLIADDYIENIYFPSEIVTENAYSKYCGYVNSNTADLINIMRNTEKWSGFLDSTDNKGIAESVTGGPTLQQFAASWNSKHTPTISISANGDAYYVNGGANCNIGISDSMYVKNSIEKTYGMVFASASASYNICLFESFYDGVIHSDSFAYRYTNRGFCPLVCLKEGSYLIIEK